MNNNKIEKYCGNCGSRNHSYNYCNQPLSSYGLICFRPRRKKNNDDNTSHYKLDYEIVMVQRKYTIGYIEFLRGKYQTHNLKYLKKIISLMVDDERNNILHIADFDKLRDELRMNQKTKLYKYEYDESRKKFNYLLKKGLIQSLFTKVKLWDEPEWGLPKGRRNNYETNLECAIREFTEETGIKVKI